MKNLDIDICLTDLRDLENLLEEILESIIVYKEYMHFPHNVNSFFDKLGNWKERDHFIELYRSKATDTKPYLFKKEDYDKLLYFINQVIDTYDKKGWLERDEEDYYFINIRNLTLHKYKYIEDLLYLIENILLIKEANYLLKEFSNLKMLLKKYKETKQLQEKEIEIFEKNLKDKLNFLISDDLDQKLRFYYLVDEFDIDIYYIFNQFEKNTVLHMLNSSFDENLIDDVDFFLMSVSSRIEEDIENLKEKNSKIDIEDTTIEELIEDYLYI